MTAGFETLGRNLDLIALPVLLDLLLWLGPRISVAPLLRQFATVFKAQPPTNPQVADQIAQATSLLEQLGESFNLLSLLSGLPMIQIPSLLARHSPGQLSPLGEPPVFPLSSLLALIPWWMGLILVSLVLGFLYLNNLAHRIRALGSSTKQEPPPNAIEMQQSAGVNSGFITFFRVFLFSAGLLVVGTMLFPPWLVVVVAATTIAQSLGILIWMVGLGMASYAALHLIFVIPSLLLGGRGVLRAVWESILLSHRKLSSVLGLIVLVIVVYEGLGFAWSLPSADSWSLLIGILGNALIATGLTAATFIFYQEQILNLKQLTAGG